MEEDKKKRKINKKKKKKKNATEQTESVTLDATESTSDSQSRVLEIEQNGNGQVSGVIDSSNDVGGHIDVDKGGNHANNSGTSLAEKHYWLDREASFQQKIKELEAEKDAQIQKESFLEEKIKQLLKENAENAQKEASEREKFEKLRDEKNASMQNELEKVEKLRDEKNASMQNEARLKEKLMQLEKEKDALSHNEDIIEQKILQLQKEVEVHMQKEASLETKFLQLEGDKSCWVQKELGFDDKISQLVDGAAFLNLTRVSSHEKIKQMEKEINSFLEEKIKQLLKENAENAQKEAGEREKVEKLRDEKNASMQNEAKLKEKLIQLEKEKDALSHNEDIIEQKILQLQKEVEVHMQKEASLETKFLQLEGEKSCWVQKEISAKESVISLTNENTKLHAQVIELEQSRESLLEENQQLSQTVSSLQLKINNLKSAAVSRYSSVNNKVTSEDGDVNYQIETEGTLVDRLMMENSELVEKVNELYAELDRRGLRREQFSMTGDVANQSADSSILVPDLAYGVNSHHITDQATDSISEAIKILPVSDSGQFWRSVVAEDQRSSEIVEVNDGRGLANTSEIIEDDEIVQISLDESEFKENKLGAPQDDEKTDVLLSDAPLIGAPFRLISFVARYVSGADLVDKNTGK